MKIEKVDSSNINEASFVHSESWKASHALFCSADFVALHTPERQRAYLEKKMSEGYEFFMLIDNAPVGVIGLHGDLIEDLYVLPSMQNKGYGTKLLKFALSRCEKPVLWILENNTGAKRLYERHGFVPTGNVNAQGRIREIEYILEENYGV